MADTTNVRKERIDTAICIGTELIAALMEVGPINSRQANLIIQAAVRAAVPNVAFFEIAERVREIVVDFDLRKQNGREDLYQDQSGDQ
jgi:hypothetical protein